MPQVDKQRLRWKTLEIFKVLRFLEKNFDLWYENHQDACVKAIEVTGIDRDSNSVYRKIQTMIKDMDYTLRTRRKSTCAIIRENKTIRDLLKNICEKSKERDEKEIKSSGGTNINNATEVSTSQMVPPIPFSIETVDKVYNEQVQKVDRLIVMSREMLEGRNKEIRDLYKQISQRRSELIKLIEKANHKLEMMKNFS
ncbi:hypothetical protein C1645_790546 [Glomus cerebriforme]|uniref:Uncharacterized protein n=1 Tax=Glomus cerebriforme TaxID=658196 RepID=A0A397S5W1_9GLOM|nr:hypothetical protein C1645_790546 [Glomus cerebriforme]